MDTPLKILLQDFRRCTRNGFAPRYNKLKIISLAYFLQRGLALCEWFIFFHNLGFTVECDYSVTKFFILKKKLKLTRELLTSVSTSTQDRSLPETHMSTLGRTCWMTPGFWISVMFSTAHLR